MIGEPFAGCRMFWSTSSARALPAAPRATADVHGHLVAVEVGVERRADERMQLDCLAFDESRLERLDAEAIQRRARISSTGCCGSPDRGYPRPRPLLLDQLLGLLHRRRLALGLQAGVDEGLEQLERHLLRQAALVQLQLGTTTITDRPE